MSSQFGAFIAIEPSSGSSNPSTKPELNRVPTAPQKAVAKNYHSVALPHASDSIELNTLEWNNPSQSGAATPAGAQTPREQEMSRSSSPSNEVDVMQTFSNPPMNRFRMVAVCLMNFQGGLSDSAPGALIPYLEKHYDIGYAIVALIFVTTALGFILAAFCVDALRTRFGRARCMIIANFVIVCAYAPITATPPFPVVVASFFFLGWGMAVNLALSNVFAANLVNAGKMLGAFHGSYGIGGVCGPLISTAMVSAGLVWSRYYFVPLAVAFFNLFFSAWSFWHYEAENAPSLLPSSPPVAVLSTRHQLSNMVKAFRAKVVLLGALFIFAYQGAEVSISGWVISFLITERNGNPTSIGYVTSGFWGGITLGRFFLSPIAHRIGEKTFVYGMVIGATVFELLVWLVPNVIGNAVAVAVVGLLLGPIFPCATVLFSRNIGRKEQVSSLSVISAFGSSGGAMAPFTTGILAQVAGAFVLHPIAIGLFAVMLVCWFYLPSIKKRAE